MSYHDFQRCRVKDKSGEMLLCEFSVYEPPRDLRVQAEPEIKLRSVTFGDGNGVPVDSDSGHARFITLVRDDADFSDHHDWPTIQDKCEEARILGQSWPAVEPLLTSEAFA